MAKTLTEDHKAAMAAGRAKAAEDKSRDTERRKAAYSAWSKSNAKAWMAWLENCGKQKQKTPEGWIPCPCDYCFAYRESNAAMPDMRSVKGETDDE